MKIGVLALQGAFIEHIQTLGRLDVEGIEIRQISDLNREFDGLILPGGESTVMGKLLRELELFEPIRDRIHAGVPVFGTCAGLLLLARRIAGEEPTHIATMDITAKRNAYGRQLGSFRTEECWDEKTEIPMVFIRAPYIETVGPGVKVLATVGDRIVAARQQNQLVTAFHPELSEDLTVHGYFLNMLSDNEK